jgi:hypothetical protein
MSKKDEKHTSELSMDELEQVAGGGGLLPSSFQSTGGTNSVAGAVGTTEPLPGPMLPGTIKTGPLL